MMQTPLVSIIIPNYNYARFLPCRMESVFSQSFTDYEVILLDDASTDSSQSLLEFYSLHPKVSKTLFNRVNSGSPFRQWSRGLDMARGKYVWIAESDDYAESEFLDSTVPLLEKYDNASVCFTGSNYVDSLSDPIAFDGDLWRARHLNNPLKYTVNPGRDYISHNLVWAAYIYNASSVLFRRSSYEKILCRDFLDMRCSGDWLFWIEMARQGDVIELYRKLNNFRQHSKSVTVNASGENIREEIHIIDHLFKTQHFSPAKRIMVIGQFLKKIHRLGLAPAQKAFYQNEVAEHFGFNMLDSLFERTIKGISGLIPLAVTKKNDRL